jgi:hypothetical protein
MDDAQRFATRIREAQRFGQAIRRAKERGHSNELSRLREGFEEFIAPLRGRPEIWQPVYLAYDDALYAVSPELIKRK